MENTPSDVSEEISSDPNIVSFVVRVWRKAPSDEEGEEIWRGHLTPVPDDTRYYLRSIEDIPAFMLDYLKSIK